jgi:hypothetical protein
MRQPTPAALSAGLDRVPFRRLYCVHYDTCLEQVCARGWRSWTCTRCRETEEISNLQKVADALGLLRMMHEAGIGQEEEA